MMEKPDPDKIKGPGGLTLRQIHEQVKLSTVRDREESAQDKAEHAISRWQRFSRYIRRKNKGKP
ncbi:hypothetical protein [Nitrosovibrio sp. Nv6]|uniref:hypothetical protein n=1 Tax=Nitrosovibrio sp. Nv6 TaxID=1855340 RepID=UPI0008CE0A42|nr:hypothetical protein [Nitrosovibrio sp. Nv6]SEO75779.1 hypothetical protein SAMN05216316_1008 [Nitrosovibrio sp. Nv6]